MVAQTFLKNFGHIADSPNGVQKLRELVMQLAVQGRLGTQNKNDSNAIELVEFILEKRRELEKQKIISRKKYEKIENSELPYETPQTWSWVRLGQIADFRGGGTPSKNKTEYWDGDVWWVSPKDMKSDYISSSELRITKQAVNETSVKRELKLDSSSNCHRFHTRLIFSQQHRPSRTDITNQTGFKKAVK